MTPYIPQTERPTIDTGIDATLPHITTPGQLNYAITRLCLGYLGKQALSYARLNETVGVVACVGHELYRRVAAGYEDQALVRNGPIR